ncbi:uncharacterized protein LOC123554736 [Mercenaria mercenaria]|uniref:uncharacterized protein LOC123554736 n=1 Tax=Mercenaria mercenaria TaxID=6596 RepID=UPI001E1E1E09|nr:uncharacterized protein LOC123554736 [Mercenaria mercenaria]
MTRDMEYCNIATPEEDSSVFNWFITGLAIGGSVAVCLILMATIMFICKSMNSRKNRTNCGSNIGHIDSPDNMANANRRFEMRNLPNNPNRLGENLDTAARDNWDMPPAYSVIAAAGYPNVSKGAMSAAHDNPAYTEWSGNPWRDTDFNTEKRPCFKPRHDSPVPAKTDAWS